MRALQLPLAFLFLLAASYFGMAEPETRDSIHFDHGLHAENGVECGDCHAEAETSVSGADLLLPSMDTCADCHDVDDEDECGVCHAQPEDPLSYPDASGMVQKFNHAAHVSSGMACADCHGGAEGGQPHAASKNDCRVCHATAADYFDCAQCHAASEPRVPLSHTAEWSSTHGLEAGWDETSCMNCHTQVDCQDCHAGDNVRPRAHDLDFAFDHALVARSNELDCGACHGDPQFCSDCHATMQILPQDHSRGDWIGGPGGGRHALEARLELESCVACHDEGASEPICAECHGG